MDTLLYIISLKTMRRAEKRRADRLQLRRRRRRAHARTIGASSNRSCPPQSCKVGEIVRLSRSLKLQIFVLKLSITLGYSDLMFFWKMIQVHGYVGVKSNSKTLFQNTF
jgi:hypothetical protein